MTGTEIEIVDVEEAGQLARQLPAVAVHEALVSRAEISPAEVVGQRDKIRQVMAEVMTDGVHYGKIPGIDKPSLLKPGAELLNVTFRLAPSYQSERTFHEGGHLTVVSKCVLTHIPTGLVLGEGEGLCTSMETKYAWRQGVRVCPACGEPTIKKSKYPPRDNPDAKPGWYCFAKIGGCGENYDADDPGITGQETGRTANPDLPDTWNTVLKMGAKRALVAAVLNVTAASDIFTQDVEDNRAAADTENDPGEAASGRVRLPASWAEWEHRMDQIGLTEPERSVWLAPVRVDHMNDVSADKTRLWAGCRRLLVLLTEGELEPIHPDPRPLIQRCIAEAFGGIVVDGPPWRIAPKENDRPTHDEWLATEPVTAETLGLRGDGAQDASMETKYAWPTGADDETPLPVTDEAIEDAANANAVDISDSTVSPYTEDPDIDF
jgi:hypothetical protein